MKRVSALPLLTEKFKLFKEGVRLHRLFEYKCLEERSLNQ
jgi:hypothetical protein